MIAPFASEIGAEDLGVDMAETTLNMDEERGDFATRPLEGTEPVGKSRTGIERGYGGDQPALVTVKKTGVPGDGGEAGGDYPFQDLRDSLEEDDNPEGSRRVVGLLARFVEDNTIRCLQGGGGVAKTVEGGEEGHQNAWGDTMKRFANRIGDTIASVGRGG